MDPKGKVVVYHGKKMNAFDRAFIQTCERELGYKLTIIQGGYNGTKVAASGGTHAGGGTFDWAPFEHARKVKVASKHGAAAWYRPPVPGLWSAHVHVVLKGSPDQAASAKRQVTAYDKGRDGLVSNRTSKNPNRPLKTFKYPPAWMVPAVAYVTKRAVYSRNKPEMGGKAQVRLLPKNTKVWIVKDNYKDKKGNRFGKRRNGQFVRMSALKKV